MGPWGEEKTWRVAPEGSDHQPAWPKPAATQQQQRMTMNRMMGMGRVGKSWKGGERESAANNFGGPAAPSNRSNQPSQPASSSINRLENSAGGTDLYRWWSSEAERGKQRRRQGGGSVEVSFGGISVREMCRQIAATNPERKPPFWPIPLLFPLI